MTDKCPPLRLPIHIEPSCGYSCGNGCKPKHDTNCETACSINTVLSSQSSYQNTCKDNIEQIPSIDIAYLSNVRDNCDADASIVLNPTTLNWCDFLTLFYRANNVFSINPSNSNFCAINFVNQTFTNTTSQTLKLNLAQQIRTAWATKCETTVDNISPKTNIMLNKETFGIKSLLNASSAISLTLDQAIETLLSNGEISVGDSTTSASVRFVVQYKYCFKPLNVCVVVNFVFLTNIPCYKNTNFCNDWCPPYSNDNNCRNCPDLAGETKDIASYLNNFKHESDDVSEFNDNESVNLKDIHKMIDDQTQITLDSSNW
jgi:hypothetical protein